MIIMGTRANGNTNDIGTQPVMRDSRLKPMEHQLEMVCKPWHETWDQKSGFGSTQTLLRVKDLRADLDSRLESAL